MSTIIFTVLAFLGACVVVAGVIGKAACDECPACRIGRGEEPGDGELCEQHEHELRFRARRKAA
jgi:hypothetical protein